MYVLAWSLIPRKGHISRLFETRVLKRISGPKLKGTRRRGRKLHNGELFNLYSSSNIINVIASERKR
jgi:hypothetical protein